MDKDRFEPFYAIAKDKGMSRANAWELWQHWRSFRVSEEAMLQAEAWTVRKEQPGNIIIAKFVEGPGRAYTEFYGQQKEEA